MVHPERGNDTVPAPGPRSPRGLHLDQSRLVQSEVVVDHGGPAADDQLTAGLIVARLIVAGQNFIGLIITGQSNLEMVAETGCGDVTPFDQHDAVELGQLAECQLVDVTGRFEPIDVGMMQRELPWHG